MRGWVAISVTATPAAAPRRIREVLRTIIRGYPLHPTEQDMISAAGIKDQELTIIVSMMLIELALLRLSRFKRLALLDTQRLELLVALHPRVWWARRAGQLASVRRRVLLYPQSRFFRIFRAITSGYDFRKAQDVKVTCTLILPS